MRSKSSIEVIESSIRVKMWMSRGNDWWIRTLLSAVLIAGWSIESSRHYKYSHSYSGCDHFYSHLPAVYFSEFNRYMSKIRLPSICINHSPFRINVHIGLIIQIQQRAPIRWYNVAYPGTIDPEYLLLSLRSR